MQTQQTKADPYGMTTREAKAKSNGKSNGNGLVAGDGLHPTFRKMREGWGTRGFLGGLSGEGKSWRVEGLPSHPSR
jgi:hypothetical protein